MNKPEPMTDDQLREMFGDGLNGKVFCEIAKMAIAARDAQWEQMLAGQEPVAWQYTFKTKVVQIERQRLDFYHWEDGDWIKGEPLYAAPPPAKEPVEWPQTPEQISDFVGANFVWREGNDATPSENDKYCLTAHDLISAFRNWADFAKPTTNHTALLEQALEALANLLDDCGFGRCVFDTEAATKARAAIAAIKEALNK